MSSADKSLLDAEFGSNIDLSWATNFGASDPYADLFAPTVNLFGAESAFTPALPTAGAQIDLLKKENWPALISSVQLSDLTETLNSSTSYTASDPSSGIALQILGTGFTTTVFGGYTVLATGTITGFQLTQNGVTIATGGGYDITSGTLLGVLIACLSASSAKPLFDMWFNIPTTVSGTASVIKSSLTLLEPYVDITAVQITDGSTDAIRLTAAAATAAAGVLSKITGDYIVEVLQTTGVWKTTGHGDGLTITDIAGIDKITGGGASETFVVSADWGAATIKDFYLHATGVGHDNVVLAKSEFANGAVSLLADAKLNAAGTAVVVTAGADLLTFTGFTTRAEFKAAVHAGDFTFV